SFDVFASLECIFFFQAEDGIRDFHVTGVQTCALPISPLPQVSRAFLITDRTSSQSTWAPSKCSSIAARAYNSACVLALTEGGLRDRKSVVQGERVDARRRRVRRVVQ